MGGGRAGSQWGQLITLEQGLITNFYGIFWALRRKIGDQPKR
jgi:hypothetical protein